MLNRILLSFLILNTFNSISQTRHVDDDGRTIKVPIVFHIIYSSEEDSLDELSIQDELKYLNLDFSGTNNISMIESDFKDRMGNPNIQFYLLDTTFQGVSKGIKWIYSNEENIESPQKISPQIDSGRCLNVYAYKRSGASADVSAHYVYINNEYIGKNTHTLTHETGHALGLWHIWGHSNCSFWRTLGAKLIFRGSDNVSDTPKQFRCTDVGGKYKECPIDKKKFKRRNYNNFMDYGACRCMFTKGQIIVMRNTIIKRNRDLFDKSK